MIKTDFLIIGSGVAGLTYAIKAAETFPDRKVTIVTKSNIEESNTKYAQGGIAVVVKDDDSFKSHIEDTLRTGDGLCNKDVVELVVSEGPLRFKELIEWGANFDKDDEGSLHMGREGGHSTHRVAHHKDVTGAEVERALINKVDNLKNITVLTKHFGVDLITQHHIHNNKLPKDITCYGAYVLDIEKNRVVTIVSKVTLIASGGMGQVYEHTTNPIIATGDGIAMARRAKAIISDMAFIQFHPTALYVPGEDNSFLISEAVRGFGAILRTSDGKEFMHKYDDRKELASRDIVSKAIDRELKLRGNDCVYLDCTHLNMDEFKNHFPNIYQRCFNAGIVLEKDMIPVIPVAHYLCGGISVDQWGQTSVKNLFASGECSRTGLHGANRLASNSLLEALVYAHRSFIKSSELISTIVLPKNIPNWNDQGTTQPEELILITQNRRELQSVMWNYVGIVRSNKRLQRALDRMELIFHETEELYHISKPSPQLCELRNLIQIGYLIIKQSLQQTQNKGAFFNKDLKNQ